MVDTVSKICSDNNLEIIGSPTDCIRIKDKKNDEGDPISSVIEKADVVSVNFPPIIDVPYRYIRKTNNVGDRDSYQITSLVAATTDEDQKNYEITAPHKSQLDIGDLICRVFLDDEQTLPIVLVMQVTEMLGTIGSSAMISHKYKCTIPMTEIKKEIIEVIAELAQRRLKIRF